MKFIFYIFLIGFTLSTEKCEGQAQGRDLLALQSANWKVGATTKYPVAALGTLDWTFGTTSAPITTVIDAWKPLFYRVHIINTVCVRNQNCGKYEIGYGYTKKTFDIAIKKRTPRILEHYRERVRLYRTLSDNTKGTKLLLSPAIEHDLSKESWRILADITLNLMPEVQLVNSPDMGIEAERYKGAMLERHGATPGNDSDIVSLDGTDATQIDIDSFLRRAYKIPNLKILFLWTQPDNCRINTWQDPRTRDNCPIEKTLELVTHLYNITPPANKFIGDKCKNIKAFKAPDIWKPLAEGSVNLDPREQLPVMISKDFKPKDIKVLSSSGSVVGSLGYYGSYQGSGSRYYSGYGHGSDDSGYQLQEKASGHVWLEQDGKCKGPLYPGRRQGQMRDN